MRSDFVMDRTSIDIQTKFKIEVLNITSIYQIDRGQIFMFDVPQVICFTKIVGTGNKPVT